VAAPPSPALAIKEKYYGKGHNELAMTLNNLGLVYSKSAYPAAASTAARAHVC
jgi:hypothetical protein